MNRQLSSKPNTFHYHRGDDHKEPTDIGLPTRITATIHVRKSLPRTVLQKTLLGARKWYGPRLGFVFMRLRRNSRYFTTNKHKTVLHNTQQKNKSNTTCSTLDKCERQGASGQ